MIIESPAFAHEAPIPRQYTCDGEDRSPPLAFSGVPPEAQALALIVSDPDAPAGTWVHWTVWNIDPRVTEVPEAETPKGGVEGVTSYGKTGYGGPCPPKGRHRYFFRLYALREPLTIPETADRTAVEMAMEGKVIAEAELLGTYERSKQ